LAPPTVFAFLDGLGILSDFAAISVEKHRVLDQIFLLSLKLEVEIVIGQFSMRTLCDLGRNIRFSTDDTSVRN
jgi:hypothetical protein